MNYKQIFIFSKNISRHLKEQEIIREKNQNLFLESSHIYFNKKV